MAYLVGLVKKSELEVIERAFRVQAKGQKGVRELFAQLAPGETDAGHPALCWVAIDLDADVNGALLAVELNAKREPERDEAL